MPGPLLPAVIAGASSLLSGGINAMAQSSMNRKTRKWNEKMYGVQRADALADWNMQNEYNSPQAQMQRLKAAGLSPNLVYGNGTVANSPSAPRSADAPSWNPEAPRFDLGGAANDGLAMYYDAQIKDATIDNLKKQNTVLVQDAALRAAQVANQISDTAKKDVDTQRAKFDLEMAHSLKTTSLQSAEQALRNLILTGDATRDTNIREWQLQPGRLQKQTIDAVQGIVLTAKTQEEIKSIKQTVINLTKDGILKDIEIRLRKLGINPNDSLWVRLAGNVISRFVNPDGSINGQAIKEGAQKVVEKVYRKLKPRSPRPVSKGGIRGQHPKYPETWYSEREGNQ